MPTPETGQIAQTSPDTRARCQVEPGTLQGPRRRRLSKAVPKLPQPRRTSKRSTPPNMPNHPRCDDVSRESERIPTQTKQIARTSQAKPCPNQAKSWPNQTNCDDVSGETEPKPGQTRQIVRTSQAKPGPNQAKPGAKPGKL